MSPASPTAATAPAPAAAVVSLSPPDPSISLHGRLDADSVTRLWPTIIPPLRNSPVINVAVDAAAITYCDGAGIALLVEIDRLLRLRGGAAAFSGLSDELARLVDLALIREPPKPHNPAPSFVENAGAATAAVFREFVPLIAFLGEIVAALAWAILHPRRVRWRDTLLVAEKLGANAVPVVCLLGWLIGLIISFQSAPPLQQFAADSLIPTVLAVAMVRELGPLVAAILLAGRSGAAFAAEIGTMKVTEEINALTTFGIQPVRFLVVPRLIAALLMTPLLGVLCTLAGILGGYVVMASLGYTSAFYITEVYRAVDYIDLLQGLFKSAVFAFLVCAIGCLRGLRTASGPGAVGDSTTRAVVAGIILVIVADGILGVVFYFVGI